MPPKKQKSKPQQPQAAAAAPQAPEPTTQLPPLGDWLADQRRFLRAEHQWQRSEDQLLLQRASKELADSDKATSGSTGRLQALGLALGKLELQEISTNASGQVVTILKRRSGLPFPAAFQLSARDAVLLRWSASDCWDPRGVVHRLNDAGSLTVVFQQQLTDDAGGGAFGGLEEQLERHSGQLSLFKVSDEVTYRCLMQGLDRLERHAAGREDSLATADILEVLHGGRQPELPARESRFRPLNQNLNRPQRRAIARALGAREVHLIHGPPGTGKTTTLVELILQAVMRGERVLACAPSNVAVDNIVEGLAKFADRALPRRKLPANAPDWQAATSSAPKDNSDPQEDDDSADENLDGEEEDFEEPGVVVESRPLQFCRVGHPARLLESVQRHSLDALVARSDAARLVADIQSEIMDVRAALYDRRAGGGGGAASSGGDQQQQGAQQLKHSSPAELRQQLRQLRRDYRQRSAQVTRGVLAGCDVVLSTLTGVLSLRGDSDRREDGRSRRSGRPFDLVVIDEAAQALELACYLPLVKTGCRRLVLAGDHQQLPPVVKCPEPEVARGLAQTLFGRVHSALPGLNSMLTVQYRMHERIMDWSSAEFYEGRLRAHESVALHLLLELLAPRGSSSPTSSSASASPSAASSEEDAVSETTASSAALAAAETAFPEDPELDAWDDPRSPNSVWRQPVWLWDTAGCSLWEDARNQARVRNLAAAVGDDLSHSNPGEADLVVKHLEALLENGPVEARLRQDQVAVISPYAGQVRLIKQRTAGRWPQLEVGTVDGFQGREKEAILISFVRSNPDGEVGFLSELRRTNVAVTRARRHLVLVLDSSTLSREPRLERLIDYATEHGEYRSAEELLGGGTTHAEDVEDRMAPASPVAEDHEYEQKEPTPEAAVQHQQQPAAHAPAGSRSPPPPEPVQVEPVQPAQPLASPEPAAAADQPAIATAAADPKELSLEELRGLLEELDLPGLNTSAIQDDAADAAADVEGLQQLQVQQQEEQKLGPEEFLRLRRQYTEARIVSEIKAFQRVVERKRAQIVRRQLTEKRQRNSDYARMSQVAMRSEQQRLLHEDAELLLTFPAYLSSFQRQQVHTVCEQLGGLWHRSVSEGLDRQVQVRAGSPDGKNGGGDPNPRTRPTISAAAPVASSGGGGGGGRRGRAQRPKGHVLGGGGSSGAGGGGGAGGSVQTPLTLLQRLNSSTRPNLDSESGSPSEQQQELRTASPVAGAAAAANAHDSAAAAVPASPSPVPPVDVSDILEPPSPSFSFSALALSEDDQQEEAELLAAAEAEEDEAKRWEPRRNAVAAAKKRKQKKQLQQQQQQRSSPSVAAKQQQQQHQQPTSGPAGGRGRQANGASPAAAIAAAAVANGEEDNDDAIFAEFRPGLCNVAGCRQNAKWTGTTCSYCRELFCVSHMSAYVHGCDKEAGEDARRRLAAQYGLGGSGSGKKMDDVKRAQLQKKLETKVKESRQGPQKKQQKKDKKK